MSEPYMELVKGREPSVKILKIIICDLKIANWIFLKTGGYGYLYVDYIYAAS
jgi:hypothetical protein